MDRRLHYDDNKDVLPRICLSRFDVDLQSFYHGVVLGELDPSRGRNASGIRQALREVVHAYKKDTVEANSSDILYDTPEKRCAYVLKHCTCFGSAVARHFLQLLRSNPSVSDALVSDGGRRIDFCCLGGGPGTEAVAVAKVIGELLRKRGRRRGPRDERLQLRVHVLDVNGQWRVTTHSVVRALNESDTFFDRDTMEVSFGGLLETDLTGRWSEDAKRVLAGADVVTMVYFVSAVNGSKDRERCDAMLRKVADAMKPGCLLFFLDSAKDLHYETVRSVACRDDSNLIPVHGPLLQQFHTLSPASIGRFLELHFHRFQVLFCLTDCFVSCAAWTKVARLSDRIVPVSAGDARSGVSARKWKKRVESNTRRQKRFREWVEKLLRVELQMDFQVDDDDDDDDDNDDPIWPASYNSPEMLYATKSKRRRIPLPPPPPPTLFFSN